MLDIKELTWEHHKNAERQKFVKVLMSGNIDEKLYATYLYNQLQCYSVLEKYVHHNDLFRQTPGLERAEHLHYDYSKLWPLEEQTPIITDSTKEYVAHIEKIQDDAHLLYCHVYVRHMGDLSGGQMIKKKTPGPNRYYTFRDKQVIEFGRIVKENINKYLNLYEHSIVPETQLVFDYATRLFGEMYGLYEAQ